MTIDHAIALIMGNNRNKYRRELWRLARGKLGLDAKISLCKKEGYTVTITVEAPAEK